MLWRTVNLLVLVGVLLVVVGPLLVVAACGTSRVLASCRWIPQPRPENAATEDTCRATPAANWTLCPPVSVADVCIPAAKRWRDCGYTLRESVTDPAPPHVADDGLEGG